MGSSNSMPANLSPLMKKLYICMTLSDPENTKRTRSMLHNSFLDQINKTQAVAINRAMSPFCPLDIQNDSNWITVCFVSPMMLIASPLYLCNKDGFLEKKLKAMPLFDQEILSLPIVNAITIQEHDICLLTLEEPYWKVGWAGVTYINSIQDLRNQNLKIINHPRRISSCNEDDTMVHVQVCKRYYLPQKPTAYNPLAVEVKGLTGSLICKIVNKKPYIVGIQSSDDQTIFFSEKVFKIMNESAMKFFKEANRKNDIFDKINLQEFEKETQW